MATGTVTPKPPTVVKMSVTDGASHVAIIIQDLEAISEVAAELAGKPEIASLISNLSQLANAALAGYADSSVIEITPENIAALQLNVTLKDPDALAGGGAVEK